jgi:hypothetical protein
MKKNNYYTYYLISLTISIFFILLGVGYMNNRKDNTFRIYRLINNKQLGLYLYNENYNKSIYYNDSIVSSYIIDRTISEAKEKIFDSLFMYNIKMSYNKILLNEMIEIGKKEENIYSYYNFDSINNIFKTNYKKDLYNIVCDFFKEKNHDELDYYINYYYDLIDDEYKNKYKFDNHINIKSYIEIAILKHTYSKSFATYHFF